MYNTDDTVNGTQFAPVGQIEVNTSGRVILGPHTGGFYKGLTVLQNPVQAMAPAAACDGRNTALTDIRWVQSLNGLDDMSGTVYAPHQYALFADKMSGTANLVVITGCIFINGADSTFNFASTGLFGIGTGLGE
jgi:hypothetical protein